MTGDIRTGLRYYQTLLMRKLREWCKAMDVAAEAGVLTNQVLLCHFHQLYNPSSRFNRKCVSVQDIPYNLQMHYRVLTPKLAYFQGGDSLCNLYVDHLDSAKGPTDRQRKLLHILAEEGLHDLNKTAIIKWIKSHTLFSKFDFDGSKFKNVENGNEDRLPSAAGRTRREKQCYLSRGFKQT